MKSDVLRYQGGLVFLHHDGDIGVWRFHTRETAVLLTKVIKPSKINVVGVYDLTELIVSNRGEGLQKAA